MADMMLRGQPNVSEDWTPGPWHVQRRADYQGARHLIGAEIHSDGLTIAEVRGAVTISGRVHPENTANAHMLTAAPDLYTALRVVMEVIDSTCDEDDRGALPHKNWTWFNAAREALAKARGDVAVEGNEARDAIKSDVGTKQHPHPPVEESGE